MSAKMPPDGWLGEQIGRFEQVRPQYVALAGLLDKVLNLSKARYAPSSFVQSRTKDFSSFADKAFRKFIQYEGKKYSDPLKDMTDLCGARIICQSLDELERVCQFIEAVFVIDRDNSQDAGERLKHDQFGYRSVHYVVELPETCSETLNEAGVTKSEFHDLTNDKTKLKAEIQARTFAQHIWADIGHDRIYKSIYAPPKEWHRQLAGLGAALEHIDEGFSALITESDKQRRHHDKLRTKEETERELATLNALLAAETDASKKPALALRIAWLYSFAGMSNDVLATLEPYAGNGHDAVGWSIDVEYAAALCRLHKAAPESEQYARALKFLEDIARRDESDGPGMPVDIGRQQARTHAMFVLGLQYLALADHRDEALERLRAAYYRRPADPYYLAAYLECEIYVHSEDSFMRLVQPQVEAAIATCARHAELGIDLPYALFTQGRLCMLINDPERALDSYLPAIRLSLAQECWLPEDIFEREMRFLKHLQIPGRKHPKHAWVQQVLELANAVRNNQRPKPNAHAYRNFTKPVIVLAGAGAARLTEQEAPLELFLRGFEGTVICGGTVTGISGLAGDIAVKIGPHKLFSLLGYLPSTGDMAAGLHPGYDHLVRTTGQDFGYEEPLSYWRDLLCADFNPSEVRVLGFGGGRIAMFEYKLAWALGAKVGVVPGPGAASRLLDDEAWKRRLQPLPIEPETGAVDSMVLQWLAPAEKPAQGDGLAGHPDAVEAAAKLVHEDYREGALGNAKEPNLRPWEKLNDDLKDSNRNQVRSAERLLISEGIGLRPWTTGHEPAALARLEQRIEVLAEREHGRWVVDRLDKGYRHATVKDLDKLLHPMLIAWKDDRLDDGTKDYDRKAILNWPKVFEKIGWEIYLKP